jgi:hypothetical protein
MPKASFHFNYCFSFKPVKSLWIYLDAASAPWTLYTNGATTFSK